MFFFNYMYLKSDLGMFLMFRSAIHDIVSSGSWGGLILYKGHTLEPHLLGKCRPFVNEPQKMPQGKPKRPQK